MLEGPFVEWEYTNLNFQGYLRCPSDLILQKKYEKTNVTRWGMSSQIGLDHMS